jgi:hypothetical protein
MSETPSNSTPPAVPPAPEGNGGNPFKVFQTEKQYQDAVNRKLANYVPKSEYQAALDRASSLDASVASLQTENQGLKTKVSGYEINSLKQKVGQEAGLPPAWIDELKGIDEASLKAHAEALRTKLGIKHKDGNPVPPITPGQPKTENEEMNGMFLSMVRGGNSGR